MQIDCLLQKDGTLEKYYHLTTQRLFIEIIHLKMTCVMTNLEVMLLQVNSHLAITGLYGLTIISLGGEIEVGRWSNCCELDTFFIV